MANFDEVLLCHLQVDAMIEEMEDNNVSIEHGGEYDDYKEEEEYDGYKEEDKKLMMMHSEVGKYEEEKEEEDDG